MTTRFFAKEAAPADLHAQVAQTLAHPAPASSTTTSSTTAAANAANTPPPPKGVVQNILRHPVRRARYNQAVWNACTAFGLLLMAAQSLKANRERKKVVVTLEQVEATSEQRLLLLQSFLLDATTMDRLIDAMVRQQEQEHVASSSGWFGKSSQATTVSESQKKQGWRRALLAELDHMMGDQVLDEAQQVTLRMRLEEERQQEERQRQPSIPPPAAVVSVDTAATPVTGETPPPKRVPFTM